MTGRRVLRDTCGPVPADRGLRSFTETAAAGFGMQLAPPKHRLSDYSTARAPRIEVSR